MTFFKFVALLGLAVCLFGGLCAAFVCSYAYLILQAWNQGVVCVSPWLAPMKFGGAVWIAALLSFRSLILRIK